MTLSNLPSRQLLDVAKQLQNFDESDESDEYLKGYQKLIANAKVDWKALGRDFDDILDEREENESDAEERKKAANDARKAAEKAALEKVRAGLPKKTELAKTYGVIVPFLSIAPLSPSR